MSLKHVDCHIAPRKPVDDEFVFLQVETVLTMSEEARVEGNVSRHIYLKYFTAGSHVLFLVFILLLSIIAEVSYHSQAAQTFTGC